MIWLDYCILGCSATFFVMLIALWVEVKRDSH